MKTLFGRAQFNKHRSLLTTLIWLSVGAMFLLFLGVGLMVKSCEHTANKVALYSACAAEARNAYCASQGHKKAQSQNAFKDSVTETFQCVDKKGHLTEEYAKDAADTKPCDALLK